ncbi:MAG: EthD domain-containing protein [Pseudomonadota bacterium]
MIKLTFCLRRKPGLSLEDFQAYWRDQHGPLVAKHKEVLGIRKYIQCHARPSDAEIPIRAARAGSIDIAPEPYDGVAELWFDSFEAIAGLASNPEAVAAGRELLQDEAKFIDLKRSPLWYGEEIAVV